MRTCTKCGETKPVNEFHRRRDTSHGVEKRCKECRAAHGKMWYAENPDRAWKYQLKLRYGITSGQYDELLERQGGVCAICAGQNVDGRRLAVDHDHTCCPGLKSCGQCVRGLLCHNCNMGVGYFGDDFDKVMAAAAYLLAHQDLLQGQGVDVCQQQ